jgi:hypothetical protein
MLGRTCVREDLAPNQLQAFIPLAINIFEGTLTFCLVCMSLVVVGDCLPTSVSRIRKARCQRSLDRALLSRIESHMQVPRHVSCTNPRCCGASEGYQTIAFNLISSCLRRKVRRRYCIRNIAQRDRPQRPLQIRRCLHPNDLRQALCEAGSL